MLTQEEIHEIEAEAAHYPTRQAVSIDALRILQNHRRWVSDDAVRDLAEYLGMTASDLDGIASFYNLIYRKPVGRHVIHLCDSVSCWIVGYERVHHAISAHLGVEFGETTADGRFTLLPIVCLGCCDRAPAMLVDGELHVHLNSDNVAAELEKYK
ncbi:MAG TPA: NADH-quinone oxidoreductase subunit NuoE [Bryobacteraceae bacterium]|nr:NADH-quinone oxidoreductase subunit NuoE [Bryobacteraceae bacterium]